MSLKHNPPKRYTINDRQLCDLEMLLNKGFDPLTGFLCQKDYDSVVERCRLSNGKVWPLPIVLAIPEDQFTPDEKVIMVKDLNDSIELVHSHDPTKVIATVHVEEIYKPNLELECLRTLGTTDRNHPYVDYILSNPDVFYVGGKVESVCGVEHYDFYEHRITPDQMKDKIRARRWDRALGFQTRNPMHNCHYSLTKYALSQINLRDNQRKGLVLQPVVGVTQTGDVDYHVRVRCYKHLLKKYHAENVDVVLCLLPLSMRMAGPREALWHSLVRANYGCTDFVVGRDHAGPSTKTSTGSSFYDSYAAHNMIEEFKNDLPINIIKSQMLVYSETLGTYTSIAECPDKNYKHLSGTELRRKLRARENIPDWFTMPEIAKELQSVYSKRKNGLCVYLIGLSGAGKTTISKALRERFRERFDEDDITLLDGDVIREHLGQGLGFSKKDRSINVRRIGYVAGMIVRAGGIVVCANIAPYEDDRVYNRKLIEDLGGKYIEVYVDTPLAKCEERDVKGLYKKARSGVIQQFTGISDPFEHPKNADICICGDGNINKILDRIEKYCFD
jgi:sulfate adenylyltransferase